MLNYQFIFDVGLLPWTWRTAKRQFAKRFLKRGVSLRLPTGKVMQIPRDSHSGGEVYVTNAQVDWGAEELFAKYAFGDFIDAGAHIGYYSLYLSPLVRRVFAFEPDPRCFSALRQNGAIGGNIQHVAAALSDHSGVARLDISGASAVSHLSQDGALAIEITTIDAFVSTVPGAQIGAIKIDVEGHDLAVLRGARHTIVAHQPLVIAEITPEAVDEFARPIGYKTFAFLRRGHTKMTFLVPRRLWGAPGFEVLAERLPSA